MAFYGKADQINWRAFYNSGTVFGFCCSLWLRLQCIVPKRDNPVDWGWVNWDHSSLAMKSRQSHLVKLETWYGKNDKHYSSICNLVCRYISTFLTSANVWLCPKIVLRLMGRERYSKITKTEAMATILKNLYDVIILPWVVRCGRNFVSRCRMTCDVFSRFSDIYHEMKTHECHLN